MNTRVYIGLRKIAGEGFMDYLKNPEIQKYAIPTLAGLGVFGVSRLLGANPWLALALGAGGAYGGHYIRKNWGKWFPKKQYMSPEEVYRATLAQNPATKLKDKAEADLHTQKKALLDPVGTVLHRAAVAERASQILNPQRFAPNAYPIVMGPRNTFNRMVSETNRGAVAPSANTVAQ